MYKPAKFPTLRRVQFGKVAEDSAFARTWSNKNGCTEEKNKPVETRYAPFG